MALMQCQRLVPRLLYRGLRHRETSVSSLLWGNSRGSLSFGSQVSWTGCSLAFSVCQRFRSIVTCAYKLNSNVSSIHNESEALTYACISKLSFGQNNGLTVMLRDVRSMSTQAKMPMQALRQGGLQVTMLSPGFVYEPYKPREPIPFWRRWFTPSGWRRTKEDMIMELKNAYTVARLRKKTGYSRKEFYQEALKLYKEINIQLASGDKASLRKLVTENMFSAFKNDLKRRESSWKSVYWELVEPAVRIRTLRARMIGVDKNDLDKAFVQLTLEFLTKQKFEAYDSNGNIVGGDKTKEVLVRDIWVLERSLFHPGSYWRLCSRISL